MISQITWKVLCKEAMPVFSFGIQSKPRLTGTEIRAKVLSLHPDIEKVANLEYKKYPYHISHYDPDHPDYIASNSDDYKARVKLDSYNYLLDRLKSDLHIQKQVDEMVSKLDRPYLRGKPGVTRNVTGGLKDYFPVEEGLEKKNSDEYVSNHPVLRNEKRWIAQSIYTPKRPAYEAYMNEFQQNVLDQRPINRHFNPDKGSKYDVEVPYDKRYPFLADRLGHPEFVSQPWERLMRLEGDLFHPVFTDQPFVQKPSVTADPTLNFEEGEVLYENTRLAEWLRLYLYTSLASYFWLLFFVPYQLLYKTHIPTDWGLEGNFYQFYQHSVYNVDYFKIHVIAGGAIYYYATQHLLKHVYQHNHLFTLKAQYSKDKELLILTRLGIFGGLEDEVYETHHLELLPHGVKSQARYSAANYDDGMYTINHLNGHEAFHFYKEDKYWNPKLKKEFLVNHSQLFSKEEYGLKRNEERQRQQMVAEEHIELPTAEPARP